MDTILAVGDFVGFLIAVLLLAGLSAAGNRFKKWWNEFSKTLNEKIAQQKELLESQTSGRTGSQGPSPRAGGPRPIRPGQTTNPSMKRPVIVEKLPQGAAGNKGQASWQPNPRNKSKGPRPVQPGSRSSGAGPSRAAEVPVAQKSVSPATSVPQVASAAQGILEAAKQADAVSGQGAVSSTEAGTLMSFAGMTSEQLRRAIVLNEVMSPPLALREEYS